MSVAKTKASDKSHSETILAAGDQLQHLAGELQDFVKAAAQGGESFDAVERSVFQSVLEMGREAITLFIRLQGEGDLGPEVETEEGKRLRRSEKPSLTTIRSIFGTHQFREFNYAAGNKKAVELKPISARMSLPAC